MKKLMIILVCVVVGIVVLSLAKDGIIKVSVEKGVELVTGLQLKIQSLKVGIANTLVGIKGLQLFNPEGYQDEIMLDVPEIYVDYNLGAIMKGKIHLEEMRIDLKEFVVVKNEKGELNLDALKVVQEEKEPKAEKEKADLPEMQIDSLGLKIDKVVYKDYSRGGRPSVREFPINLNEKYTNITDPNTLVRLIVVKALMNTTIGRLANFDLNILQGPISDTLGQAQQVAADVAGTAQETIQKTSEATRETVKEATGTIKKQAEDLRDAIKLPFGSKE